MATMRDPAWKSWYRGEHDQRCRKAGEDFEQYVTALLKRLHPDFINPDPMGRHGDGGCDGLAERGRILYACYGADPRRAIDTEERRKDDRAARKLASDLKRALVQWPDFVTWRFVTNASVGPMTTKRLNDLRNEHGPASNRPLTLELWKENELWFKAANLLTPDQLDEVLPGVPRSRDVELKDLVDLIALLEAGPLDTADLQETIAPVPDNKMDYNGIPLKTRLEFNEGRFQAVRIDQWFDEQVSPDLRDAKARRFREIYERARKASRDPAEIVEAVYNALAEGDFRRSTRRANAVYAVTAYFFDSCDIFEAPPIGAPGGETHATADQRD